MGKWALSLGRGLCNSGKAVSSPLTNNLPKGEGDRRQDLAGVEQPSGSKAAHTRRIASMSAGAKRLSTRASFSTPMPCSAVMLPPQAMHSRRISLPAAHARATSSRDRSWNSRMGCTLPSQARETLTMRMPRGRFRGWVRGMRQLRRAAAAVLDDETRGGRPGPDRRLAALPKEFSFGGRGGRDHLAGGVATAKANDLLPLHVQPNRGPSTSITSTAATSGKKPK